MVAEVQRIGDFAANSRRQKFELIRQQLENERTSFESHWRELVDNIQPRRGRFFVQDSNRGDRRSRKLIDTTPALAVRNLSAGMMGGITSPARPWFRLSVPDAELDQRDEVKRWTSEVARLMIDVFLKSNLYQTLPIVYKDLGTFATAAVVVEEDFETVMRTFPLPIGSYMLGNDEKGRVRVFFREFRMTVRQIVDKFGRPDGPDRPPDFENISKHVEDLWRAKQREQWIEINHIILPNEKFDSTRGESKFKRYISVYYERGSTTNQSLASIDPLDDTFLSEMGYDNFPVLGVRWEVNGEDVYGSDCPGMTALGDVKQVHLGERRVMQAIAKIVNPPMKGPAALKALKASILPGDITYLDERDGQRGFTPVHEVDPRIIELESKQQQIRQRIKKAFYEDLFLQLSETDRREITAREVEERHEEKLLALGSVLERLNQDLLDPLIDIAFEFMLRQGLIPEPPEELRGVDLKVEYISIMAQAQKLAGLAALERFVRFVIEMSQVNPNVFDKVDLDKLIDEYADITGVPPDILVSDDQVAVIREARQRQQQQQAAVENIGQVAGAAKDLSKADLEGDNALARLTAQAAAGGGSPAEIAA